MTTEVMFVGFRVRPEIIRKMDELKWELGSVFRRDVLDDVVIEIKNITPIKFYLRCCAAA